MQRSILRGIVLMLTVACSSLRADEVQSDLPEVEHVVVFAQEGKFAAWPANHGAWIFKREGSTEHGEDLQAEILVGFTLGRYAHKADTHSINRQDRIESVLARSRDGGETWHIVDPDNYVGDDGPKSPIPEAVDFYQRGLAMCVFGVGYMASQDRRGGLFVSVDRGNQWRGPYSFGDLPDCAELAGWELTPRTDYVVIGKHECLLFISARAEDKFGSDKIACVRTRDGCQSFEFLSWVVPSRDPYRAVMSQTVKTPAGKLVCVMRRRQMQPERCWIDAYQSADGGKRWTFGSRVGETGKANGNPPAMALLNDGRLCCVYGNRTTREILGRYSDDEGESWGPEFIIRSGYDSGYDDQDFGYPRLVQRGDGRLVAIYYWASRAHPQQHIAASIWAPHPATR